MTNLVPPADPEKHNAGNDLDHQLPLRQIQMASPRCPATPGRQSQSSLTSLNPNKRHSAGNDHVSTHTGHCAFESLKFRHAPRCKNAGQFDTMGHRRPLLVTHCAAVFGLRLALHPTRQSRYSLSTSFEHPRSVDDARQENLVKPKIWTDQPRSKTRCLEFFLVGILSVHAVTKADLAKHSFSRENAAERKVCQLRTVECCARTRRDHPHTTHDDTTDLNGP